MQQPCGESPGDVSNRRMWLGQITQALLQDLGLILRTLKSFEKGNDMTRFVFEEASRMDWLVRYGCGEIS